MFMKKLYFVLLTVLFAAISQAQVASYTFSQSVGAYTAITGGTVLGNTTSDDQYFVDPAIPLGGFTATGPGFPIGFNFNVGVTVFDRVGIQNNGWISLGQSALTPSVNMTSTSTYTPLSSTAAIAPAQLRTRIAGIGRDIQGQAGSELRIETIGSAPNRVCVIQFTGYRKFNNTGDNFSFQIRLSETTNLIDVVYNAVVFNATSNTADVGLGGSVSTDFNNRTTTTDWNNTTAGLTNTDRCTMLNTVIVPVNGRDFTWTPAVPCTNPTANGTAAINLSGAIVTISACSNAGEYSTITGAVNGQTLRFTSSVATDFITIHSGTFNGPVLAFGTTPLVFANTFTGTIYAHWNTPGCGSQAVCRTTTVQCTSCAPTNELCTGAFPIACGGTVTGTTVGFNPDAVAACNGVTLSGAPGIWYTFVGNGATNTLTMCGSGYDTEIGVFTGTCAALVCVTANDDFCGLQSQVTFATTLGTTYYILITGFGTASGTFTLTRTSAPLPNDVCTGAININCGQTITGSTACGATIDAVGTCVTALGTAPGLWYQFVGDGSPDTLSLCGSSYDTKIGVFRGTCAALVCVTGNDDFCGLQSRVTFNTNAGFTYYILVTGFGTATGNFTLTRTCAPPCSGVPSPGSIAPATSTVCVGSTVTLTLSGYPPNTGLTFQWNSAPAAAGPYTAIAGATSNVYTFTAAATAYYTITVTCTSAGGGSSTTAPPVVVNVSNIQFISAVATPSTVCSPGSVTITGTVTGGLNLGNYTYTLTGPGTIGAPVPSGPNNSSVSFSVTNIPAGNQVYTLTATDPVPCSKSTTINVTVNLTPVVTLDPVSATICNGAIQYIKGTVTTGAGTFVYSPLTELFTNSGATITYTGTALNSGDTIWAKPTVTRTYTATVTSAQGCSSTTPITITVNQLPAIVTQPSPATQTVCPGVSVNYTVVATGTGLTYQWRRNGVNLVNGGQISGANTATLTIGNVAVANAGTYDVVVSGACPPPVTSAGAVLNVASSPTVPTPANQTICSIPTAPNVLLNNTTAVFTSAITGTPPATIFQWQISTNGGGTWTNLANSTVATASPFYSGVFTNTLTITNAPVSSNNNQFRLVVTNSCGQTTTSGAGTLTVNASPVVVAIDLFNQRICISDTLVPLVGTPIGGFWTGIGVSGFNFVPTVTAVGSYTLTYTYTNGAGCTVSDTTKIIVQDCPERLRELTDEGAVIIFPNPSNGRFNVRLRSTLYNYLGIKTYDMNGHLMVGNAVTNPATKRETLVTPVYTGLYYGRTIPIDLSNLASGTYLLVIYYDDGVRTSKKGFTIVIMK
jgi:Secretion system C-terminal sorting domain